MPTAERPLRIAEFDELFRSSLVGVEQVAATRLRLRMTGAAEETARELAARETSCCSFFGFEFTADGAELIVEITVPDAQARVLEGLAVRADELA